MYRVSSFVSHFARALLGGALVATIWVNLDPASYYDAIEWHFLEFTLPGWSAGLQVSLSPLSVVANIGMALFLFFVGKELWEAIILDHGDLRGRASLLPLSLSLGGLIGTGVAWAVLSTAFETAEEAGLATGWQVPLGSDVVLCYLVGRRLFGPDHPALRLLLLLTIASDILAVLVLGLSSPVEGLRPLWLALPVAAALLVWHRFGRQPLPARSERHRRARLALWPYILAGCVSWLGVAASGLPPMLGFLPVIPAIAHADRSFGVFAEIEELLHDPLNRLAHLVVWPIVAVLFLLGLTRGGIDLSAFAPTTVITVASLWLGRPIGMIVIGAGLAALFGLRLPAGVTLRDVLRIAIIMGMGFTIPVLGLEAVLPGGAMQEAARLGLALGLLAGLIALVPRSSRPRRTSP